MWIVVSAVSGLCIGAAVIGVVARWRTIRALDRLREAEQRARSAERLAEIGAMTGGLAHEIKNPLSTIGLNAQLLAEGIEELPQDRPIEPEVRSRLTRRLGSLRREVERLRGILQDFLSYAGELRLDLRSADVNSVVEELADFFLPQAEQAGVRLRTDLSPGPLLASIDAPLLKQAVLNLMLNAVQAMTATDNIQARELILRTRTDKGADKQPIIRLHVIDTGPGMAPGVRAKLFQPYFTTKTGGTGLGLPTTRRIIEAHQGTIAVFTEVGRGTDFAVTLPAHSDPATTIIEPRHDARSADTTR